MLWYVHIIYIYFFIYLFIYRYVDICISYTYTYMFFIHVIYTYMKERKIYYLLFAFIIITHWVLREKVVPKNSLFLTYCVKKEGCRSRPRRSKATQEGQDKCKTCIGCWCMCGSTAKSKVEMLFGWSQANNRRAAWASSFFSI